MNIHTSYTRIGYWLGAGALLALLAACAPQRDADFASLPYGNNASQSLRVLEDY